MGGLKKGNIITFGENGFVCQTQECRGGRTSINLKTALSLIIQQSTDRKTDKMQTLKTALSLIREFCLKIDWCLSVYNHEASNRVFEVI